MKSRALFIIFAVILGTAGICGAADLRARADAVLSKGLEYLKKSEKYSAGTERNECFQNARILFERALELYQDHLEKKPGDAGELEPRLTEINSQIFWCNKLTTVTYDKSKAPTAEQLMQGAGAVAAAAEPEEEAEPEPVLEEETAAASADPLSEEEEERIADEARVKEFLTRVSYLVTRRRVVEARFLCRKALNNPAAGIPEELAGQVLVELDYVNNLFSGVFDKAMAMKGQTLAFARTITDMRIDGTVNRFDKGLLYISSKIPGSEDTVEMGIPLFSMDDTFLIRYSGAVSKKDKVGIAAFYLLEGKVDNARKIFEKLATLPGDPEDMTGFLARVDSVGAEKEAQQSAERQQQTAVYLNSQLSYAIAYFERGNFDGGMKNIDRIVEKSGLSLDFLMPISKACFEKTKMYLPEFAKEMLESCRECGKKRQVTCPKCNGMGKIKPLMGEPVLCTACGGRIMIECPSCKKRLASKRNNDNIDALMKLFKRDREPPADAAGDDKAKEGAEAEAATPLEEE